jgi:hypothetical protein
MMNQLVGCGPQTGVEIDDNGIVPTAKIAAVGREIIKLLFNISAVGRRGSKQKYFKPFLLMDGKVIAFEISIELLKEGGIKFCLFIGQIGVYLKVLTLNAVDQRSRGGQGTPPVPEEKDGNEATKDGPLSTGQ